MHKESTLNQLHSLKTMCCPTSMRETHPSMEQYNPCRRPLKTFEDPCLGDP